MSVRIIEAIAHKIGVVGKVAEIATIDPEGMRVKLTIKDEKREVTMSMPMDKFEKRGFLGIPFGGRVAVLPLLGVFRLRN